MPSALPATRPAVTFAIARAIAKRPSVLLCDEPTSGLDRAAADSILELLRKISQGGRTIVMVTHDPHAAAYADRRLELGVIA